MISGCPRICVGCVLKQCITAFLLVHAVIVEIDIKSTFSYSFTLMHVCIEIGLHVDNYCKGRLAKHLVLHCDFGCRSCVSSTKAA